MCVEQMAAFSIYVNCFYFWRQNLWLNITTDGRITPPNWCTLSYVCVYLFTSHLQIMFTQIFSLHIFFTLAKYTIICLLWRNPPIIM